MIKKERERKRIRTCSLSCLFAGESITDQSADVDGGGAAAAAGGEELEVVVGDDDDDDDDTTMGEVFKVRVCAYARRGVLPKFDVPRTMLSVYPLPAYADAFDLIRWTFCALLACDCILFRFLHKPDYV